MRQDTFSDSNVHNNFQRLPASPSPSPSLSPPSTSQDDSDELIELYPMSSAARCAAARRPDSIINMEPIMPRPASTRRTIRRRQKRETLRVCFTHTWFTIVVFWLIVFLFLVTYGLQQDFKRWAQEARFNTCEFVDIKPEKESNPLRLTSQDGRVAVRCKAYMKFRSIKNKKKQIRFKAVKLRQVTFNENETPSLKLEFDCTTAGLHLQSNSSGNRLEFGWYPVPSSNKTQVEWRRFRGYYETTFGVDNYLSCGKEIYLRKNLLPTREELIITGLMIDVDDHHESIREAFLCQ